MGWRKWLAIPLLAPLACAGFSGSDQDNNGSDHAGASDGGGTSGDEGGATTDAPDIGPGCTVAKGPATRFDNGPNLALGFANTVGMVRDVALTTTDALWLDQEIVAPPSWSIFKVGRPSGPAAGTTRTRLVHLLEDATAIAIVGDYVYFGIKTGVSRVTVSCGTDCTPEAVVTPSQLGGGRVRTIVSTSNETMYITTEGVGGAFELRVDTDSHVVSVNPVFNGIQVGMAIESSGNFWWTQNDKNETPLLHHVTKNVPVDSVALPTGAPQRDWLVSDCKSVYIPRYDFDSTLSINVLNNGKFGDELPVQASGTKNHVTHLAVDTKYLYVAYAGADGGGILVVPTEPGGSQVSIGTVTNHIAVDDRGVVYAPATIPGKLFEIPKGQ